MTRTRWYVFSLAAMCWALTLFVRAEVELSTWEYWTVKAIAIWAAQPFIEPFILWALDRIVDAVKRYVIDYP